MAFWLLGATVSLGSVIKPGFIDATSIAVGDDDSLINAEALVDFGELPVESYFATRQTNASLVWDGAAHFAMPTFREESAFAVFRINSIEELEQYIQVFSNDISALTVLGVRLFQADRVDDSLATLRKARIVQPDDVRSGELLSGILMQQEDITPVLGEVQQILDNLRDNSVVRYNLACAYARTDDPSGAFYHLNILYQTGWNDLVNLMNDSDLDNLRADPRFKEFQDILLQQYRQRLNQTLLESIFRPKL